MTVYQGRWTNAAERPPGMHLDPPNKGDENLVYFVPGNTSDEDPWAYHATVFIADDGVKLSASSPSANGCILSVLKASLNLYSTLAENKPFLHRYITDEGLEKSSIRPWLENKIAEMPDDEQLAQHLSSVYENAVGGPRDLQSAYKWLLIWKSALGQDKDQDAYSRDACAKQLHELAMKLSPDEISSATASAEKWEREHPKKR
jgi:hypothetical protein